MPASLTRPIHIFADSLASDIPCYIISPDDVISAIRENKTLFLKLLLRLDDTASWLSSQDLLLLKLHAYAVHKMQASLHYEIRKKQLSVIREYLGYVEGSGAKKDEKVNMDFLKGLLAPLASEHHPLYNYIVTIEYLSYFNQLMSYLQSGDSLKYKEATYAFGEEGFEPEIDEALKSELREDIETLLAVVRSECELTFAESVTIEQLDTYAKELESLAAVAQAEVKKIKHDYDAILSEVEAGYASVRERRGEIERLGSRFAEDMPTTVISSAGMTPSAADFKKKLIKTFSRSALDPLTELIYGRIKATPLHFAIHHLQDKIVDLFLKACIDRGENPLGEHRESGRKVIDRSGNTVLHLIAIILNEPPALEDESKLTKLIKMLAAILETAKQIKRGDVSKILREESLIQREIDAYLLEAFLQKNRDEKTVLELLLTSNKRAIFALLRTYITPELIRRAMEGAAPTFESRVYTHLIAYEAHLKRLEESPKNRELCSTSLVSFEDDRCKDEIGDRLLQRRKALESLWLALWLTSQTHSNAVLIEQIKYCCEKNAGYSVLDPRFSWGYTLLEPLSMIMKAYISGSLEGHALSGKKGTEIAEARAGAGAGVAPSLPANGGAGKASASVVTSASKELDLNACGLGGLKFKREAAAAYCHSDLSAIPNGIEVVYLCHNGFYEMDDEEEEAVEASALLIRITLSLPPTVHTLYLEGNGFELYNHDELAELFSKFPKNIKWVSLAGEKPRPLAEQLVRLEWPESYYEKAFKASGAGFQAVADALLKDYAGGSSWWRLKFVSHWHDHYAEAVRKLLSVEGGTPALKAVRIMVGLKNIDKDERITVKDSLFSRYAFLVHFAAGKPGISGSTGYHPRGAQDGPARASEGVPLAKLWPKL
jgi:hypothetical protein